MKALMPFDFPLFFVNLLAPCWHYKCLWFKALGFGKPGEQG